MQTSQSEEEPGSRSPAPGALRVVQLFINSVDIEAGTDEFSSPRALSTWLKSHGLLSRRAPLRGEDLARATEFRELLRLMVLAHNGEDMDAATGRALNRRLAGIQLVARFESPDALRIEGAAAGVDGALGRMVGILFAAMQTGEWYRLKACARDICRWVFYDHSRNRTGTWCSMKICGARSKALNYYWRQHSADSAARSS
jgi:predicted RNA-binding Zn ribbon-like protein